MPIRRYSICLGTEGTAKLFLVLFQEMGYNNSGLLQEGGRNMSNQEEWDIIELEGDDGSPIRLCVERYFFYNGSFFRFH